MATRQYLSAGRSRMGRKREYDVYQHNRRIDREGKANAARIRGAESSLYPFYLRGYFERFGEKFVFDTFVKKITSIEKIRDKLTLVERVANELPTAGDRIRPFVRWSQYCIDEVNKEREPWEDRAYAQKIKLGVEVLKYANIQTKDCNTKVATHFESANGVLLEQILPAATSEETLREQLIAFYGDGITTTGSYLVSTVAPTEAKIKKAANKLGDFTIRIATMVDLENSILYERIVQYFPVEQIPIPKYANRISRVMSCTELFKLIATNGNALNIKVKFSNSMGSLMTAFTHTLGAKATLNTFFCFLNPDDSPERFTNLGFSAINSVPIEGILILPAYSGIRTIMFVFKNIPHQNVSACGSPYFSDNLIPEYHDLKAQFQAMRKTNPVLHPLNDGAWLVGIGSTINTSNRMSKIELEINGFSVTISSF
jgi:hypothetical protein